MILPDTADRRGGDERGTGWRPVPDPTSLTTEALHREIGTLQQLIQERISSLSMLMDEKLKGVEAEFALVERQRVEQKVDAKEALAAALQAAEKAVEEQTKAARKDIDALGERVDTALTAQSDAIGSLTGRITVMEAIKIGTSESRAGLSTGAGLIIGGGGLVLSFILVGADLLTR